MNTLSTLQYYGPKPGFHHGLDLATPAGTRVVALVGGAVSSGYYYRRKTPYTYELAIETDDGWRWEFHHLDPETVPDGLEAKAANGDRVEAGELLGRVYDASAMGIEPHVHINLVGSNGFYLNPVRLLPLLADDAPPTVRGVYLEAGGGGARRVEDGVEVPVGVHELVIDAYDVIPDAISEQALYALHVTLNERRIGGFRFDRLPRKDFLAGEEPGRALHFSIRASDFAGNTTEVTRRFTVIGGHERTEVSPRRVRTDR